MMFVVDEIATANTLGEVDTREYGRRAAVLFALTVLRKRRHVVIVQWAARVV